MLGEKALRRLKVEPGTKVHLKNIETDWSHEKSFKTHDQADLKDTAVRLLKKNVQELEAAQNLLYANDTKSLLIILQGMDAAGKDGTIKHVMSGINPQGCSVHSFKQPSTQELAHSFLWRYGLVSPERGRITIFNRSYYEDVVAVKVHPEWIAKEHLSTQNWGKLWKSRFEDINAFEHHLSRNGTIILKFFLHLSKKEQKHRLLARLNDTSKLWKFSPSDLAERKYWDEYRKAYENAISATCTSWAPWYIVPADFKWVARTLVAEIVTHTITSLNLKFPTADRAILKSAAAAKSKLQKE